MTLMTEKLVDRKRRESGKPPVAKVSDKTLFAQASNLIEVKRGN